MELIDLVDENNQLIGNKEDKEIAHEKGLWHRECAAWIYQENGDILIQKRAATKKQSPNKWGLCAGHIQAGEEPIKGMLREIKEELGIEVLEEELEFARVEEVKQKHPNGSINNTFVYRYFLKTNIPIDKYIIQEEELSELKYISLEELKQIIATKDANYTFSAQESTVWILKEIQKRIKK